MEPLFDHEKLDVYCVELQFIAWIADFFDDVSRSSAQPNASSRSHLFALVSKCSPGRSHTNPPARSLRYRQALIRKGWALPATTSYPS